MAKQAKMKKGSIGKKALAAILAASMVLSSSAFSVLASVSVPGDGDVTVPDEGIATASLNEDNGIATATLKEEGHQILVGFVRNLTTMEPYATYPDEIVFNNKDKGEEDGLNVIVVNCSNPGHTSVADCWRDIKDASGDAASKYNGDKWRAATDDECQLLDANKNYYNVKFVNNRHAGEGPARTSNDLKGYEKTPYVVVNFSNNQLTGKPEDDQYANLGSFYYGFKIEPLNLDDVTSAITKLQYGKTYNGQNIYPGMDGVQIQLNGETIELVEGVDYVPRGVSGHATYPTTDKNIYDGDLKSASALKDGNTNDPVKNKKVVLVGMAGAGERDADGNIKTGDYTGVLGDQHYDGRAKRRTVPGYDEGDEYNYPFPQSKTNDNSIVFHINQRTRSEGDIKVDDIRLQRKVGDADYTAQEIINELNGAGGRSMVHDSLRSTNDPEYNMICDNMAGTTTNADYSVKFWNGSSWGDEPNSRAGSHQMQITMTGKEDYVKGSSFVVNYTIGNPSRLQRAIDDGCEVIGEPVQNINGVNTVILHYNGKNYYPSKWTDKGTDPTIQIVGKIDTDPTHLHNSGAVYGTDYVVSSPAEEWKNAKSYDLVLQGLDELADESVTIKVIVESRHINELSLDEGVTDKLQYPTEPDYAREDGKTGYNGRKITNSAYYNIENTKIYNEEDDFVDTENRNRTSAVRVIAEQGKHTKSGTATETIVKVIDSGLDSSVGNKGEVTLVKDVDYTVEEKTENGKKYVVIKGLGNYTTVLNNANKDLATVYEEEIEQLDNMPLDSESITGKVLHEPFNIVSPDQTIQLTMEDIELFENDPGYDPIPLDETKVYIKGYYDADGKYIEQATGIKKAGSYKVVIGAVDGKGYVNTKELPFTVVASNLNENVAIDPIQEYTLGSKAGDKLEDVLEDAIVVRYSGDALHPTFNEADYTVTVKDPNGNVVAFRKFDSETTKDVKWYKPSAIDKIKNNESLTTEDELAGSYKVTYGTYTIVVESTDYRYQGTVEATFDVVGRNIANERLNTSYVATWSYTGKEIKPPVTVKLADGIDLIQDTDFEVDYSSNVNAGTGVITVKGKGIYSGSRPYTFTIEKAAGTVDVAASQKEALKDVTVGSSDVLTLEVTVGDEKITDEKMSYELSSSDESVVKIGDDKKTMNYVGKGTATITVTPKSDNVTAEPFTIEVSVTKEAAVKEPEAHLTTKHYSTKAKTIGLTTNKIAEATKWQVRYATKKDMTGKHTKTVNKAKRLYHMTLNVKKSKTKYYVRVRAYVNGEWTKWSEKESIKSR